VVGCWTGRNLEMVKAGQVVGVAWSRPLVGVRLLHQQFTTTSARPESLGLMRNR